MPAQYKSKVTQLLVKYRCRVNKAIANLKKCTFKKQQEIRRENGKKFLRDVAKLIPKFPPKSPKVGSSAPCVQHDKECPVFPVGNDRSIRINSRSLSN